MLLGVDVGGTFTDAALVGGGGSIYTAKVPTTPGDQAVGVLEAVGLVLGRGGASPGDVERLAHGMTVATNALLEGRTARTALIATAGFTDAIELGRQARPSLYRLCEAAPAALVAPELRFGAPERCGPEGVLVELDPAGARALVEALAATEPRAVAVALLHSYAHPEHERELGLLLEECLPKGTPISLSSELVGTFREYERTATTVLDAALSPLVSSYLGSLARECTTRGLPEPEIMQSSGGLCSISEASRHAAVTVLSGPAGGVGGALLMAGMAGVENVLCFDMGGTSCDVCLIAGSRVAETVERTVAGRPLALATLDIHTVGAGGGSIAWRDSGGALRVGPQSAGAVPGPACYGRGEGSEIGQATVTDANLLLGRLPEDTPLAGGLALDRNAAEAAVWRLGRELGLDTQECAAGIVRVAEAEMARALRVMTVERGIDPRDFALMPFGGAGPLHACGLAQELGIARILCPRASGVLCALGLAAGAPRRDVSRTVMLRGETFTKDRTARARGELLERAGAALGTGSDPEAGREPHPRSRTTYELRYRGQSFELDVESDSVEPEILREEFNRLHEQRYGYRDESGEIELVTIRVSVWGQAPEVRPRGDSGHEGESGRATGEAGRAGSESGGGTGEAEWAGSESGGGTGEAEWAGSESGGGTRIEGPAVYVLPEATLYVAPGWSGEVDEWGIVDLRHEAAGRGFS
jgi:N-methylhydantoinase A